EYATGDDGKLLARGGEMAQVTLQLRPRAPVRAVGLRHHVRQIERAPVVVDRRRPILGRAEMSAVPSAAGIVGELRLWDLVRKRIVGTEVVLTRHRAQPGFVQLPAHPVGDAACAVVGEDVLRLHGEVGGDAVDGAEGSARQAEAQRRARNPVARTAMATRGCTRQEVSARRVRRHRAADGASGRSYREEGAGACADFTASASATALSCASPRSKSPPTILSMSITSENALPAKSLCPSIVQVTCVVPPWGVKSNRVVATEANGLMNSSLMAMSWPGRASMIVMRPSPTLSLPFQA